MRPTVNDMKLQTEAFTEDNGYDTGNIDEELKVLKIHGRVYQ